MKQNTQCQSDEEVNTRRRITEEFIKFISRQSVVLALTLATGNQRHQCLGCYVGVNGGVNGGEFTKESLSFTRSMKEVCLTSMGNSQHAGKDQGIFNVPVTELFLHCIKLSMSLD